MANEIKNYEGKNLNNQIYTLEFEISKALLKVEQLNRAIDQKTFDLKAKEQ